MSRFASLIPKGGQAQPAAPTTNRFAAVLPKIRSDEGRIQGALVNGLEALRIKREQQAVEERNRQRAYDPTTVDTITGEVVREQFDPESFRPLARQEADQTVAGAFGKYDFRRLDPAGIMAGVADEKLAARYKAAVERDDSELRALDYDEVGKMNGLLGQYDVADLQDVVGKIRESFPEYGKGVDPNGLRPSEVVDKFRREHYPDLTYDEMMAGFGKQSRAARGMQAQITDAEPKQATYGEALFENFRAALPRLYTDIKVIGAEISGDEAARKEAMAVRDTINSEVAAANRGNDDTILGAAGLSGFGSLPTLVLGGVGGSAAGGAVARAAAGVAGYRAARAGKAAIDAAQAAKRAELFRKIGSQTTFAATVAPTAYVDAREQGASATTAALNALGNVAIEAVAEIPLFGQLAKAPKTYREAIKEYGKAVAGESLGEAGAAVLQPLWDNLTLGYDEALSNEELGRQALIGGLAGAGLGATVGAAGLTRDAGNIWRETATVESAKRLQERLTGTPPAAAPQPVPAAPAPAAAATPAPAAPAPQQAAPAPAPAPTQPAPGETEQQTAQRALRESKAREDFTERLAEFEQSQGRAASQPERERIATEVATDYEVLRATIYKPSQDTATATPTQGAADVRAQQQPATRGRRRGGAARPVDAGGVPAGGVPADADVPGGGANVTGASAGVAGRRADELGTAPAPTAPADQAVRPDNADAALTPVAQTQTEATAQSTTQATPQTNQSSTPGARTVRISNRDFEVAPENVPLVEEADRAYEEGMRQAAAQFERESRASRESGADPDIGAKTAMERFQAERKALGMRRAAAYRQAAGIEAMTPKERAAKAKRDAVARPGDQVTLEDGSAAEVVKDAGFGRLTVRRPDGQTVTVPRASVAKAAPASAPPAAPAPEPFDLAAAVAGQVQQRPIQLSQQVSGATGGDQPQRRAQSATPAPTPAQAEGGRREAPEAVRQPEGQGQGQGRSEGLPDAVEPDAITFADPGQAMTRVPVEVPGRDGKPTVVNVPIGSYLSALSKRVAACQTLLNCMRRG